MGVADWADPIARANDIHYVRLLIGDTHPDIAERLFTDTDIETIGQREQHLWLTAAQLLDLIAGSELLLGKKISSQDLSTDGVAVAQELRRMADNYRLRHQQQVDDAAWGLATFEFQTGVRPPEGTERPWGGLL